MNAQTWMRGSLAACAVAAALATLSACTQEPPEAPPPPVSQAKPVTVPTAPAALAVAQPEAGKKPAAKQIKTVSWQDLSESQRTALAPLADDWNSLDARQQQRWVQFASRYPSLSEVDQQRAQERMRDWAIMTPEERMRARSTYRQVKSVPREERLAHWEQYQTLTEDQKRILSEYGVGHETAAAHVPARTGLARQASKPLVAAESPPTTAIVVPSAPIAPAQPGSNAH